MNNKTWKSLLVLLAVLVIPTVIDCGHHSPPPPTNGFKAQGQQWVLDAFGNPFFLSYASIQGIWQFDYSGAQGSTTNFLFYSQGFSQVPGVGRAPARWLIYVPQACIAYLDQSYRDVAIGSNQLSRCLVSTVFLAADPSSINLASPPPVVNIGGGGFDTTYGMPVLEYYDQYSGVVVASSTAFSVASGGSSLQAYTPDLSGLYSGSYTIVVSNIASDGSYAVVGVAPFSACCMDPPPPDPPPDPPPCSEGRVCEVY